MKTELIEKFIRDRNLYEGRLCEMYFTTEQLDIIIQALTSVKSEQQYPINGYAPGNYTCNCSNCNAEFTGDKRAVQCEPCAIKGVKSESAEEKKQHAIGDIVKTLPKPKITDKNSWWCGKDRIITFGSWAAAVEFWTLNNK